MVVIFLMMGKSTVLLKHSLFACIAIGNLSRKDSYRRIIQRSSGLPALVQAMMSHDYEKKRHSCRALANMSLSASYEIVSVFQTEGLIKIVIKLLIFIKVKII